MDSFCHFMLSCQRLNFCWLGGIRMGWKYLDVFVLVMGCFGYTSAQIYFLGSNEIPMTKTALNRESAGKPSLGKFSSYHIHTLSPNFFRGVLGRK